MRDFQCNSRQCRQKHNNDSTANGGEDVGLFSSRNAYGEKYQEQEAAGEEQAADDGFPDLS